jgi:hypothetical protein
MVGALVAAALAWFSGMMYREGSLVVPFVVLMLVGTAPFLLYAEPSKRVVFSLLAAALFSGLSLLTLSLGGQATGPTVFGLGIAAVAVLVGVDLIVQDFGTRVIIASVFARSAGTVFLSLILPLSGWIIAHEHSAAVEADTALIRAVAQHVSPQGNTIVFDQVDPQQKNRLQKLVSVRASEKTYDLSEAEVESIVNARTVRRQSRLRGWGTVVSHEQEEHLRMVLKLQGAPVPGDIVLFSYRGPIAVSELRVPLDQKNPG